MAHYESEREMLLGQLADAANMVDVGGHYTHYRNPDHVYEVTGFGIDEDTTEIRVEYQRIDENPPLPWRRRLKGKDGWLTPVVLDDKEVSRFNKVEDK